jgi:hypothetical protein
VAIRPVTGRPTALIQQVVAFEMIAADRDGRSFGDAQPSEARHLLFPPESSGTAVAGQQLAPGAALGAPG